MSKELRAHIAVLIVNLLYGANFAIAKGIMPAYIGPFAFVCIRVLVTSVLFVIFHALFIKEKIERVDVPKLILCGIFGVAINQMLFFKGLSITSPINGAIVMTTNPILVLIIAAIVIKERITPRKIAGIVLGISGACTLLLWGKALAVGESTWHGDLYIFINALSWAIFLVMVKPLMHKYRPLTVIKWTFLFGIFFSVPFGLGELSEVQWSTFTPQIWMGVTYVVIGTTFLAYLLNTVALGTLSPSVVSFYIYLQPFFATVISLFLGKDALTIQKVIPALLIFTGVYLVSMPSKENLKPISE